MLDDKTATMLSVLLIQTTVMMVTVIAQQNLTPFGTASQSSSYDPADSSKGMAGNAVNVPISNYYSLDNCSSTKLTQSGGIMEAWWMFNFSFGASYITDITIYYRQNYAIRMNGFQLYVTNTSTIPPVGYLCYEDRFSQYGPYPNITQTIPCNQLGKYVIYYDKFGSDEGGQINQPVVELCYVAIHGCQKNFWGSKCEISCPESCIGQHCFPGNGSCIFGCDDTNCLKGICDKDTAVCTEGCQIRRTGSYCSKYNLVFDSSILMNTSDNAQVSLVKDGNLSSCVTTQGSYIWIQVDLAEISIVREIYITLIVNTINPGNHTIYASNTSHLWGNETVLYLGEALPDVINVGGVFRYLTYVSRNQNKFSELEVCEIGIVGCPPTHYGPVCSKLCPVYCSGPCDLETGNCTFGCVNGWIGVKCELGPLCYEPNSENLTTDCSPEIYQVYPTSGPINGGTLLTISGNHLGNINDSISINISGVRCHNVTVTTPYTELTCVIEKYNGNQTTGIFVSVNANRFSNLSVIYFTYKEPQILNFSPKKGILSGNTTVAIQGQDIVFEGQNRYTISFCDNVFCIECSEVQTVFSLQIPYIKCKTGISSEPRKMTHLNVVIDDLTVLTLKETFQYLPDPTFNISTEIPKALQSGGVLFTIRGEGFNNVGSITVERVNNPCDVPEDTSTVCETPPRLQNQPYNQTIDVHFDGVTIQFPIEYVEDPTFEMFKGIVLYDKESAIEIEGRSILNVARREDYHINIGLDGICLITDISMDNITCYPPKSVPRTNSTDDNTVYVIVNVIRIKSYIGDLQYKTEAITGNGNTFVMIVGILVAGLVVSIIIGMSAVLVLRRKKTKAATEFQMKIKAKEEIIQKATKEGERIANLRREDGNAYTEPDESVYDEINVEEEKNTRGNSYLDVNEGYDELGQRSPTNPYNQLQQTRDDIQRRDIKNNEMNADDQLQNNKRRNDYLSLFSGYEKPISRNDTQN